MNNIFKHNNHCLRSNSDLRLFTIKCCIVVLLASHFPSAIASDYDSVPNYDLTTSDSIASLSLSAENDSVKSKKKKKGSRWEALMNWNFMAIPYAGYAPETDWQFGALGVYYFRTRKNCSQFSDLNFDFGYSLNKQWNIDITSRFFFDSSIKWYLDAIVSAKIYPDYFFGIGNDRKDDYINGKKYNTKFIDLKAKPNFYISKYWLVGADIHFRLDHSTPNDSTIPMGINGFGKSFFLGLGAAISYDSRTNTYFPKKGLFFKFSATYNQQFLSHKTSSANLSVDLRHFVPIYKEFIFAWQFRSEFELGRDVAFQLLPTLGGLDLCRGFRQNRFKDQCLFALQAEFRIPIWKFLKATVFGSIGDVYNYNNWHWAVPKVGYGVGLRACIHEASTNIRFDVARQNYRNYGDEWNFYFTVKEAF